MNLQMHLIRRFHRFSQIDQSHNGPSRGTHAAPHGSIFDTLANLCNLRNLRIESRFAE
jgi:hypothetical protein